MRVESFDGSKLQIRKRNGHREGGGLCAVLVRVRVDGRDYCRCLVAFATLLFLQVRLAHTVALRANIKRQAHLGDKACIGLLGRRAARHHSASHRRAAQHRLRASHAFTIPNLESSSSETSNPCARTCHRRSCSSPACWSVKWCRYKSQLDCANKERTTGTTCTLSSIGFELHYSSRDM